MKWLLIISVLIVLALFASGVESETTFYSFPPPPPTATATVTAITTIPTPTPVAEVFIPLIYN